MTAAAASLALILIPRQVFWGPMTFAMKHSIVAGKIITLIFTPALCCAVFQVTRDEDESVISTLPES